MSESRTDQKKIPGLIEGTDQVRDYKKANIKAKRQNLDLIPKGKNPRQGKNLPWKYIFPLVSFLLIYYGIKNFERISTFIVERVLGLGLILLIILLIFARLIRKIFTGNLTTIFMMWLFSKGDKDE